MTDGVRHVDLGHGARLVVRRTTANDRDLLRALFKGLSTDDRYRRFFSPFDPDDTFLDHLATANEHGACQLVAVIEQDGKPDEAVAEAGAWPRPNGNAELGITVKPGSRGWLGPYVLDALAEVSAAAGIANLEAEVLMTNRRMLALLRPRGYVATNHDGYRSARVVVSTTGRMPSWPAIDDRPRLLVEAPAARWDGEETALAEGVQLIVCPGPKARPGGRCPALDGETCPLAEQADTIVTHLGERFDVDLERAHRELHPGVPVCVHRPGGNVFEMATHAAEMAKEHKRS